MNHRLRIGDMITVACAITGLPRSKIVGANRDRSYAIVRAAIYSIARRDIDGAPAYSLPEIGKRFGRDHTSVMNGCAKIDSYRNLCPVFDGLVNAIAMLTGQAGPFVPDGWVSPVRIPVGQVTGIVGPRPKARPKGPRLPKDRAIARKVERDAIRKREERAVAVMENHSHELTPATIHHMDKADREYRRDMERASSKFLGKILCEMAA